VQLPYLQALICNAAIYFPNAVYPTFTKDGFEVGRYIPPLFSST
jgi:hypothetical protein